MSEPRGICVARQDVGSSTRPSFPWGDGSMDEGGEGDAERGDAIMLQPGCAWALGFLYVESAMQRGRGGAEGVCGMESGSEAGHMEGGRYLVYACVRSYYFMYVAECWSRGMELVWAQSSPGDVVGVDCWRR